MFSAISSEFSTTRTVTRQQPVLKKQAEDKFETVMFLPEGGSRQGEGGLRTQGYFKTSLEGKPLITVVTVVFNDEKFLEETILNIINQSYDNMEYIIIDGGSTDGTLDIIKKYEHVIDYWVSESDKGIYDAMNKGINLATGDWLNFMNSGDSFHSDIIIKKIFNNDIKEDVVFGKSISYHKEYQSLRYENFETERENWYLYKMPNHQATFIRKNIYKKLTYDLDFKYSSDTDYLRKVFNTSDFFESNEVISLFKLGGKSNYYGNFNTYKDILINSIKVDKKYVKPILKHTIKFILQKIFGHDKYLKYYIKYLVKN